MNLKEILKVLANKQVEPSVKQLPVGLHPMPYILYTLV